MLSSVICPQSTILIQFQTCDFFRIYYLISRNRSRTHFKEYLMINFVYLNRHQKENVYYTHTLNLQEEVCSACFTNDTNHILVATNFGQINVSRF